MSTSYVRAHSSVELWYYLVCRVAIWISMSIGMYWLKNYSCLLAIQMHNICKIWQPYWYTIFCSFIIWLAVHVRVLINYPVSGLMVLFLSQSIRPKKSNVRLELFFTPPMHETVLWSEYSHSCDFCIEDIELYLLLPTVTLKQQCWLVVHEVQRVLDKMGLISLKRC